MTNPFIYVLINGSLGMSPGKVAAQSVHAVAALHKEFGISEFSDERKRTVTVLEADSQQQMENLWDYLYDLDIPTAYYIDEGVNEISPYSFTALAIGPIESTDYDKRDILSAFPLFPNKPKKKWFKRK